MTAWVLAPAPDIVEAHLAYCRWHIAALLRAGRIWLDDDRAVVGGQRLQVRLRPQHPEYRDPRLGRGGYASRQLPDLPAACRQRLRDVSTAGMALRPSSIRRTFLVLVWGRGRDDAGFLPALTAGERRARAQDAEGTL